MVERRAEGLTRRAFAAATGASLSSAACGGSSDNLHLNLPAPTEKSTVGPGDVFTMEVVGERDLPKEYQIASDGTVDLPYVHTVAVAGLEPQEVARLIRKLLMEKKVLN